MTQAVPAPAFESEVARVRVLLQAEGRSDNLLRLFDYLCLHAHDLRAPKEIEIAFEVFGKDPRFDTTQDAMVRVWVHRLRARLDDIYRGVLGPRLILPKGEYRMVLAEPAPAPAVMPATQTPARPAGSALRLAGVLALVTLAGWGVLFHARGQADPRAGTLAVFGQAPLRCGAPLVVAGDSYLYLQTREAGRAPRLVMRPTVGSAAQLPPAATDRDTYYMAANGADGLWSLLGALAGHSGNATAVPEIVPASKLTQQALNRGNIVYFGRLDQLAALHDAVFEASGFAFDPATDTLTDQQGGQQGKSGHAFTARLMDTIDRGDGNPAQRPVFADDYGYLARIVKPDGCAVWIVAGLEDAALAQMARIASDPAQRDAVLRHTQGAPSFEALYEIRSAGALRYESRLVLARPLRGTR